MPYRKHYAILFDALFDCKWPKSFVLQIFQLGGHLQVPKRLDGKSSSYRVAIVRRSEATSDSGWSVRINRAWHWPLPGRSQVSVCPFPLTFYSGLVVKQAPCGSFPFYKIPYHYHYFCVIVIIIIILLLWQLLICVRCAACRSQAQSKRNSVDVCICVHQSRGTDSVGGPVGRLICCSKREVSHFVGTNCFLEPGVYLIFALAFNHWSPGTLNHQEARLVIQPFQTVTEDIFNWSVGPKHSALEILFLTYERQLLVLERWTCDGEVTGTSLTRCTVEYSMPWTSHSCTSSSVTRQCNLVLVEGRWYSEGRKVTAGLASHWPCVIDFVGYSTCGLKGLWPGDEQPRLWFCGLWHLHFSI